MKISDFNSWLQRDFAKQPIILIHGPDAGLVHERASAIIAKGVDNKDDPFQLVRLDGDEVAADPLRLIDEANTIGMFGGRRVIWLRVGGKQIVGALTPLLATPPLDALVVIEAGDLKKAAPLRTICEKSTAAASIICYGDEAKTLLGLVQEILQKSNLTIQPEARDLLLSVLGADRAASRGEIEKLALYCHGEIEVTITDIEAILSDVAVLENTLLIDAAYLGDLTRIEARSARLFAEGLDPGVLLNATLRHALILKKLILHGAIGGQTMANLATASGIFFKRHAEVERQLRGWKAERLDRSIAQLSEAVAQLRKMPALGEAIATRALWSLALASRRRG